MSKSCEIAPAGPAVDAAGGGFLPGPSGCGEGAMIDGKTLSEVAP